MFKWRLFRKKELVPTKSHSKVKQMADKSTKKKAFSKSDLGYYDDEAGYERQLAVYQKKGAK